MSSYYVQLGSSCVFVPPCSGPLRLFCNDGYRQDNSGSLSVVIDGPGVAAESFAVQAMYDAQGPVVVGGVPYTCTGDGSLYWSVNATTQFTMDGAPNPANAAPYAPANGYPKPGGISAAAAGGMLFASIIGAMHNVDYHHRGAATFADWANVTPSDTLPLPQAPCRGLYVAVGGNVAIADAAGNTATLVGLTAGEIVSVQAASVLATGTTATGIVALY